jgi:signal transduction protein with GAF and PtsI domain
VAGEFSHAEGKTLARDLFKVPAVDAACRRTLEDICRFCGAEEATVWLISENGCSLQGTVNLGKTREVVENLDVPVEESLVGMVASTGIGLCFGSQDPYNRTVDGQTGTVTRAMVAVPLDVAGELVGVLSAINPRDRASFQRSDLEQVSWRAYVLGLVLADMRSKRL